MPSEKAKVIRLPVQQIVEEIVEIPHMVLKNAFSKTQCIMLAISLFLQEVAQTIPHERISERVVGQTVDVLIPQRSLGEITDVPAPQTGEENVEVIQLMLVDVMEPIVDVPVPHVPHVGEKTVDAVKDFPQEHVQQRTVDFRHPCASSCRGNP